MADELQRLRAALQDPPPPRVRLPPHAAPARVCAVLLLALGVAFALHQRHHNTARTGPRRAAYDDDPLFQPF